MTNAEISIKLFLHLESGTWVISKRSKDLYKFIHTSKHGHRFVGKMHDCEKTRSLRSKKFRVATPAEIAEMIAKRMLK